MKLYIKRDKTIDGALFAVLNESGENKYYVKSTKNHVVLCDLKGKTLLKIKRILLPALRTYTLVASERTIRFLINPKKSYCGFTVCRGISEATFSKSLLILWKLTIPSRRSFLVVLMMIVMSWTSTVSTMNCFVSE